jgi:PIN domain nuclease of toxin-antitoxin system
MNFLLDTCVVIWSADPENRLSASLRKILEDPDNAFYVSAATAGELACAQDRGRIELPVHWKTWFRQSVELNGWRVLPITLDVMEEAWSLPGSFHPDPSDRILVATARIERLTLLTADAKILAYPHVSARD